MSRGRLLPVLLASVLVCLAATADGTERVRREVLANGLTVLVRENPVAPVVAASLLLRMGTRWETTDNAGISNFVQAVMVKGTARRSGAALAEAVAALGGKLSASGDVDYSEIRASALSRFWRELLGLTAELALEPLLAADEVDIERRWLEGRVQRRRDVPTSRAFDELYALLFDGHPYGLSTLGSAESLRRVDHPALVQWYRVFYRPERMVLAVSGQVNADEVVAEARRLFGGLPGGATRTERPLSPVVHGGGRRVVEQAAQQTQILVGAIAPPLDHPDQPAVKVLSTVLGGGMAGRLFVELRDRRALAYTATSFYDPTREPGALVFYLGTSPETAAAAEQGLAAELARVQSEPVSAEELARAKRYLLGRYTMDNRTNERIAWHLAFYELQGVGLAYPERYRAAVEAVSIADVQRVARAYLARPATVVLGPRVAR